MSSKISAEKVRYIKLGQKGEWEDECLEKGIIRFGFDTGSDERFPICVKRKWSKLQHQFITREKKSTGTAARHMNEVKFFFEDQGETLWITFIREKLYWGTLLREFPKDTRVVMGFFGK